MPFSRYRLLAFALSFVARSSVLLFGLGGALPAALGAAAPIAVHGITSAGTKVAGDTFTIRVTFSDPVFVTGTPQLTLETGDVDRVIPYESGSGTTYLFFRYTVQLGDTSPDLDYVSTTALALNGGTILDADGNDATLTLPAPGSSGSLAANEAFVIDGRGTAPTGLALSSTRIHERMAVVRAAIGTLSTTDSDSGDAHTYTLVAGEGDTHNGSFAIDGDALLVATPNLAVGNYSVRVRTTDVGGNTFENAFTLTVSNTPQTGADFNRANPEHWFPTTTGKYSIATWEPAIGERGEGIYTIEFQIEATGYWPGREGFIYGIAEIPFSDTSFHDLGAKSREWGFRGWEAQKAVEGVASNFGSIFKEIGERIRLHFDTRTGTLSIHTKRIGDTDFSLEGGAPLATGIEVAEGKKLHFAVSGIAWQPAGVSVVSETFPNAAPTDISLSSATIAQSAAVADATVGTFASTDDAGDAHTYALVSGEGDTHNSSFVIDGATLKLGASMLAPGTYSLRVKTTDAAAATFEKIISVTVAPPTAVAVHGLTTAGTKGSGASFLIRVTFSDSVAVTGTPQLTLETGAIDRIASYESGSGTQYLEFRYIVRPGDSSPDLDYVSADALALNGGTIRDAAGNDATLTLPVPGAPGSLSANAAIRIAASANNAPRDFYLSSNTLFPADALAGETVGTLQAVDSDYGDVHTYSFVAGEGDTHNASFVLDGATLKIAGSALTAGVYSVRIRVTDASDTTFEKALNVAVSDRLVTGVDSLATNGTYRNGDTFLVRITYSDVVFVTGTPTLTLETGTLDRAATYESGSGTAELFFRYTVRPGDRSSQHSDPRPLFKEGVLDYVAVNPLSLAGGTLRDADGNDASLVLPRTGSAGSLSYSKNLYVLATANTTPAALVLSNTYLLVDDAAAGATIGTLAVTDDEADVHTIGFVAGEGDTHNAAFSFDGETLRIGDAALAAGTYSVRFRVTDLAGAVLEQALAINIVDVSQVSVVGVSAPTGAYYAGRVIDFTVTFNQPVLVDTTHGTPRLALTIGDAPRYAHYVSGSGTTRLTFRYWVLPADVVAGSLAVNSPVDANGGFIGAGSLTFTPPDTSTLRIVPPGPDAFGWGSNGVGQLGRGTTANASSAAAVNTSTFAGKIIAGLGIEWAFNQQFGASYFVTSDGLLYGVGYVQGTLYSTMVVLGPEGLINGKTSVAVAGGNQWRLILSSDGELAGWGVNSSGQLGNDTTTSPATPVPAFTSGPAAGKTIVAIAGGHTHSLVLSSDGQVFASGDNNRGQLGDDTTNLRSTPVAVPTSGVLAGKTIVAIAAGAAHSLALSSNGEVFAWGYNALGQLGDGTNTDRPAPVAVVSSGALAGKRIIAIAAGSGHSLALSDDGQVFAWGSNASGRLGDGTSTSRSTPVAVGGALTGEDIVAIAAGYDFSLAVSRSGKAFGWGENGMGQLGNGTTTDSLTPVAAATDLADRRILAFATSPGAAFTVAVAVSNSAPSGLELSTESIAESAATPGATVATLNTIDPDADDAHTYSFVSGEGDTHNASFTLDGAVLKVGVTALAAGSYSVRIRTTDIAGLAFDRRFTITVIDADPPQVVSIERQSPATSPTDADTLVWRVTFSEAVANVDAGDFTVSGTTATISVAAVPDSGGAAYDVTISGGDLAGLNATVTLAFAAGQDLADTAGNALADTAPSATNDVTFVLANNAAPSDLALSSESINQSAALAGATIGTLTTTDADADDTHTYAFANGDGDTDNRLFSVAGATLKIGDAALAAGSYSVRLRTTDPAEASFEKEIVITVVDDVAPGAPSTPDLIAASDSGRSNNDNLTNVITPTFTGTAEAGATVKLFSGDSQIGTGAADESGNWTITASALAPATHAIVATATDAANNTSGESDALEITIKTTAPVVTVGVPSSALTRTGPVIFAIAYSDSHFDASSLALGDLALNKTGTADGTLALTGDGTDYIVTVSDITGDGTLGLTIAAGTAADLAGNLADAVAASTTFAVDNTAPAVVSIVRQTPATVHSDAATLTWRVAFDSEVTGVDVADFAVTTLAGETGAQVESVSALDAATYDVTATVGEGLVPLRLDLNGAGTGIADLAGNAIADGGFESGEFYVAGAANVFETMALAADGTCTVTTTNAVAQRFTTAAAGPLSLNSLVLRLGEVQGAAPAVSVHRDDAGMPGAAVGGLENPDTLMPHALNVWTGRISLEADTTYWIVFAATAGDYGIATTEATAGGSGEWLGAPADYGYVAGWPDAPAAQSGALHLALGATSVPTITSALTASGTYKTAFSYTVTATNTPTSYEAVGLPTGLSLDAGTGVITGAPTQTGAFDVELTATNGSGTGPASTLVLTIGKAALTAKADAKSRRYGSSNPPLTVSYTGLLGGDTAASLTTAPTASTTATASSPVGTYAITVSGGVSDHYTFTYEAGALTVNPALQTISFTGPGELIIGATATLSATASSGLPVSFSVISGPASLSGNTLTATGVGTVTVRASQAGDAEYDAAANVDRRVNVTVGPATVTTPTQVPTPPVGGTAELIVHNSNPNVDYTWQRNGANLPNGSGPSLTLGNMQPPVAGLYTYTATVPGGGSGTSAPVIVGLTTDEKVVGTGDVVGSDIQHPNGNIYDQVLLEGNGASVTADPNKIMRLSFVDLSNDIVQVEFSGAGTLSVVMDDASSPSPAANYNQPGVDYVKGHVGLVITGANETSHLTVFTVGRITAVNQTLFKDGVDYDGVANIAFVAIQSTNGKFGSIRTGNAHYFANQGFTGVYAPGVTFTGPVNIGDVTAFDSATPVLVFGAVALVQITGGNLAQDNGLPVTVGGIVAMKFVPGTTSQGDTLPAQANAGVLTEDGVDVTDDIVVAP